MVEKKYKYAEKKLKELFERDREELSLKISIDFVKQKKREPTDKEMLDILNKAGKKVADFWKKYPKNFKWVKKKSKGRKCPKCGSKNVVFHTDKKLRAEQKLVGQCWDCDNFWKVPNQTIKRKK